MLIYIVYLYMKALPIVWKTLFILFASISVIVTGYYYVYQGFFADKNSDGREEVPKEVETIVEEKLEELVALKDIVNKEAKAWAYLAEVFNIKAEGKYEVYLKVNNSYFLNNLFQHNFFQEWKEHEMKIIINQKEWAWTFLIDGKINGRSLVVVGKYDAAYVYIDSLVGNGILSMINRDALNYFFDSLGGYIDYWSFSNKKVSFIPLSWIDMQIGKSQEDYYSEMVNAIINLFSCNKDICSLKINESLVSTIKEKLDSTNTVSEKQKMAIISLSTRVIGYISWSSISLQWWNGYEVVLAWEKLDFNIKFKFTKEAVNVKIDKQAYTEKQQDELLADFINRNPLFTSILTNKDITEELLK